MNKLLLSIEAIEKDLEDNYQSNTGEGVYQEFSRLYNGIENRNRKNAGI